MTGNNQTKVVNFKDVKQHWDKRTQTCDSDEYVYIGRFNPTYRLPKSKFANPFRVDPGQGRGSTLLRYKDHLSKFPQLIADTYRELRGKTLVCWCRNPHDPLDREICHGDVLRNIILQFEQAEVEKSERERRERPEKSGRGQDDDTSGLESEGDSSNSASNDDAGMA